MRIAIIGTGIGGLYAAHRLHGQHDLTLFESKDYVGGHTHTVDVEERERTISIDTGFIVFNNKNYPHFSALLDELQIASQPSEMSFSFSCRDTGLEYRGGRWLGTMFAQRSNLFRTSFHRMLRDIWRFNNSAGELITSPPEVSLGEFLGRKRFSGSVVDDYLLPMAGAIWSAPPYRILDFPASQFGIFFRNHGLLQVRDRPQWMTVAGGSREYVQALTRPFLDRIRLNSPVSSVQREADHVVIKASGQPAERFDAVLLACHSDQALKLLDDPSPQEKEILGDIPYQTNEVVLHTDTSMLPRRRRAWGAWNYHRFPDQADHATVTYNLSLIQSLPTREQYLVTLNSTAVIDPAKIVRRFVYDHPVFDRASMNAQKRHAEINGRRRTFYAGAYWGYGFHEDGVKSAIAACEAIEASAQADA